MGIKEEPLLILTGILFSFLISVLVIILFLFFKRKTLFLKSRYALELKNKELETLAAVVHALEQERTKISRNIHDEVGAILTLALHGMKNILNRMKKDSEFYEDVHFSVDVLDQSVVQLRNIVHAMVPHYLMKFGLLKSLKRLTEQTNSSLKGGCTLTANINESFKLDEQLEIHFYSITLELINNLLKHAKPMHVQLELTTLENSLVLSIEHDGIAINQEDYTSLLQHAHGMGLESVSYRLRIISGELRYSCNHHGGSIELSVPFKEFSKTNPNVETEE